MARPSKVEGEKKVQRTIQFEPEILEWLEKKAKENDRTTSQEMNRILRNLKKQKEESES